jgi:hypothetical protein
MDDEMMIVPNIEDIVVRELERRIVAAVPDTAPGNGETPETFVSTVESRLVERNMQEQSAPHSWTAPGTGSLTLYAWVTAEVVVIFYSQKRRYDYCRLIADFASDPMVKLTEGVFARVEMRRSESADNPYMHVTEGPYLNSDAWLFEVKYPVIALSPEHEWQPPLIANVTTGAPDIFAKPEEPDFERYV